MPRGLAPIRRRGSGMKTKAAATARAKPAQPVRGLVCRATVAIIRADRAEFMELGRFSQRKKVSVTMGGSSSAAERSDHNGSPDAMIPAPAGQRQQSIRKCLACQRGGRWVRGASSGQAEARAHRKGARSRIHRLAPFVRESRLAARLSAPRTLTDGTKLTQRRQRRSRTRSVGRQRSNEAKQCCRDLPWCGFHDVHDGYDRLGMVYEARGENRQAADCYRKVIGSSIRPSREEAC